MYCPTKTQISLRIHAAWLKSSLSAWRNFASLAIQNAPSEDSDQTARMRSLIRIFAGRTCSKFFFRLTLWFIFTRLCKHLSYGPRHAKTCLRAYSDSEIPDELAYLPWTAHSMSANRITGYYGMYDWDANARMRLCACVGWREITYFVNARRHFFACRSPPDLVQSLNYFQDVPLSN